MSKLKPNAVVCQSGGPTTAINATLCGVIKRVASSGEFDKLYGAKNGILGLLNEDLVVLNSLFGKDKELSLLRSTPGCALGSCRYRLDADLNADVYERIFDIFRKHNIRYFFYIGGNDSMDTVAKLSQYNMKIDGGVSIIGLPKTIDNDLVLTDHTPGYPSACKYVANTTYEIAMDIRAYNIPSVTVVETMGRDAGWLCCASALSKELYDVGSDLIYLPEMTFSIDRFLGEVDKLLIQNRGILVSISEGVDLGIKHGEMDAFGHVQNAGVGRALEATIKKELGCKVRSVELNLPQRCAAHFASGIDLYEAQMCGSYGIDAAIYGFSGKMVTLIRHAGEYGCSCGLVDATRVANKVKVVPSKYINEENNYVTKECIDYILPMIKGEADFEQRDGLAKYFIVE